MHLIRRPPNPPPTALDEIPELAFSKSPQRDRATNGRGRTHSAQLRARDLGCYRSAFTGQVRPVEGCLIEQHDPAGSV